jgi:hypothetical protein
MYRRFLLALAAFVCLCSFAFGQYGVLSNGGIAKRNLLHLLHVAHGEAITGANLVAPSGLVTAIATTSFVADIATDTFSVAVRPTEVGPYTLVVTGAAKRTVIQFESRETLPREDQLGYAQRPVPLADIGGTAIPASKELTGAYEVSAAPLWWLKGKSTNGGQGINASVTATCWLNWSERYRIPWTGLLTGIVIPDSADLSASNLTTFQVIVFRGSSLSTLRVVGRSENVGKARLNASVQYIQFQRPPFVRKGDRIGLLITASAGTVFVTNGTTFLQDNRCTAADGATDVPGTTLTSASTDFSTKGIDITKHVLTVEVGTYAGEYAITAVAGNTITVNPAIAASQTNLKFRVALPAPEGVTRGLMRIASDPSDTVDNTFSQIAAQYKPLALPIYPVMSPPLVALAGHSIMGGTEAGGSTCGTFHDYHQTRAYAAANDPTVYLEDLLGVSVANCAKGGSDITGYRDPSAWSITQYWPQIAVCKPGAIVYTTIVNDCTNGHSETTYRTYLDKLFHQAAQIDAELILTTDIPVPVRTSPQQLLAAQMRAWTINWAWQHGVPVLDTFRAFRPNWLGTESTIDDGYSISGQGFPDYSAPADAHLKAAGYRTLARAMASELGKGRLDRKVQVTNGNRIQAISP